MVQRSKLFHIDHWRNFSIKYFWTMYLKNLKKAHTLIIVELFARILCECKYNCVLKTNSYLKIFTKVPNNLNDCVLCLFLSQPCERIGCVVDAINSDQCTNVIGRENCKSCGSANSPSKRCAPPLVQLRWSRRHSRQDTNNHIRIWI